MRFLLSLTLLTSLLCAGPAEDLKKKLDSFDKEIAAQKAADKTALGAARLEELRVAREKVATMYRRVTKTKTAAKSKTGKDGVYEIDKLIARGQTGDLAALTALRNLKLKIDAALAPKPQAMPNGVVFGGRAWRGQNVVVFGNGMQVLGLGGMLRAGAVPAAVAKKVEPKKAAAKNSAANASEPAKKKLTEQELLDQEMRAIQLEKQLIEMTRKVLALERRLIELRAKVAKADER